jgi:hypothetical protein
MLSPCNIEKRVRCGDATTRTNGGAEVTCRYHPIGPLEHDGNADFPRLRGELGATLAAARREDRTPSAGAHAETKTVNLGTTPIVRLESSLAHSCISKVQL